MEKTFVQVCEIGLRAVCVEDLGQYLKGCAWIQCIQCIYSMVLTNLSTDFDGVGTLDNMRRVRISIGISPQVSG